MAIYKISVTETYSRDIFVQANNADEAREMVESACNNDVIDVTDDPSSDFDRDFGEAYRSTKKEAKGCDVLREVDGEDEYSPLD